MSKLNTKIKINNLELKNRLVMPPMASSQAFDDGNVSDELLKYYDEKTISGSIGLVIVEHCYVSCEGQATKGQLSISDDINIDGLKKLVEIIHKNGSKVFAQLNHAGGNRKIDIKSKPPIAPSKTFMIRTDKIPEEISLDEIKRVVQDFKKAAIRAKKAGFDGVEIHSAHGYLLNQFYSPLTNKREDVYGFKTIESRVRIHLEIIEEIRSVVGSDYPIALRLGGCDYMEGGSNILDSVKASKIFEKAGIDLLDISGGFCGYLKPGASEQGYFSEITEAIKKEVKIPVLLTGGVIDKEALNNLLDEQKADLIGVGRAILKDSNWAKNAILY